MPVDYLENLWDTAVEAAWREIASANRKLRSRRNRRKTRREKLLEKIEQMLFDDDFVTRSRPVSARNKRSVAKRSKYNQHYRRAKRKSRLKRKH